MGKHLTQSDRIKMETMLNSRAYAGRGSKVFRSTQNNRLERKKKGSLYTQK